MLAAAFDPTLGGRLIDEAIGHHLAQLFNKPGMDVTKNKRGWIRLLAEVGWCHLNWDGNEITPHLFHGRSIN